MRFRGQLREPELLSKMIQLLLKVKKTCIVWLSSKDFKFIINGDPDALVVWAGCEMKAMFGDFLCESMNDNNIGFQLQLDQLERAVKSLMTSHDAMVKLTKKSSIAMLTMSGTVATGKTHKSTIVQDVPLQILSPQQLAAYVEPITGDPDVYILFPTPLHTLRAAVDKLKNIADVVTVWANMSGQLKLSASTDLTDITVDFTNLSHPTLRNRNANEVNPQNNAEVAVDVKNLGKVLNTVLLNPESVILCLSNRATCVVHTLAKNADSFWITFHVPVFLQDMYDDSAAQTTAPATTATTTTTTAAGQ